LLRVDNELLKASHLKIQMFFLDAESLCYHIDYSNSEEGQRRMLLCHSQAEYFLMYPCVLITTWLHLPSANRTRLQFFICSLCMQM